MQNDPAGTSEQAPQKTQEQQLNRACEACRLSKVRCLVNTTSSSSQCQRCAKAERLCVFAPPAKRRQRKRTDVRVAELEREVRQMRSLLRSNHISPVEHSEIESVDEKMDEQGEPEREVTATTTTTTTATATDTDTDTDKWSAAASQSDKLPNSLDQAYRCGLSEAPEKEMDIVDRGLISIEMAQELLDIYRRDLVFECPGVVVPSSLTVMQLRHQKPALFHAVMAAASHCKGIALSNRLHEEVIYFYAKSLFIKAEKSLQHIQALLVTVTYYNPPNSPAQLQIFQYGNMAASMALELGMASKPRTHEQLPRRAIRSLQRISSPDELLENCRTILLLYTMCAGFAMRLRRPNILSFNSWMEECVSLLQKSPILDDQRVVAWLQLQRIADEANTAFGFDDASTSFSLSELRLQVVLRVFERKMENWRKSVPKEIMSLSLMIEFCSNTISMWEFGMDGGQYSAPDFKNSLLTLPALDDDCVQPESLLSRSALQINATIKCISAAHSLLDAFIQIPIEQMQKASNIIFVRCIFALVALLKADYAVGTDSKGLGEVLDSQSLKVDYYLDTVLCRTSEAIGFQKCRVPSHWLVVLNQRLKTWHDAHQVWRKEGKHLNRREPLGESQAPPTTEAPATTFVKGNAQDVPLPPALASASTLSSTEQGTGQLPNFPMSNPFTAPWPTTGIPLMNTNSDQPLGPTQPIYPFDMGDFSQAFQHGDLYLWNDVNDNFGGWMPQGGSIYSDMQFGALNNDQNL